MFVGVLRCCPSRHGARRTHQSLGQERGAGTAGAMFVTGLPDQPPILPASLASLLRTLFSSTALRSSFHTNTCSHSLESPHVIDFEQRDQYFQCLIHSLSRICECPISKFPQFRHGFHSLSCTLKLPSCRKHCGIVQLPRIESFRTYYSIL